MRSRLLGLGVALALLLGVLGGCSTQSAETGAAAPQGQTAADLTRGTVNVYLADPETGVVHPTLDQALRFTGLDDNGNVTFGPVTFEFAATVSLPNVPVETTQILIEDPADPSLEDLHPVVVQGGGLSAISDINLVPRRTAVGAAPRSATSNKVNPGPPIQLGPAWVQTKTVKDNGANAVMSGWAAFSATPDLKWPYKTNTWLAPILGADNHTKMFLGGQPSDQKPPPVIYAKPPRTVTQKPVYSKPWVLWYRYEPPIKNNNDQGILISPEDPAPFGGYEWAGPKGEGDPDGNPFPRSGKHSGELNAQMDIGNHSLQVDPGWIAPQIKVRGMSDLHAELITRNIDDPNHDTNGIAADASLRMFLMRGSPFVYFRTYGVGKITFRYFLTTGGLTNQTGSVTVNNVKINYVVQTGKFARFNRELTFLVLVPATVGTFSQSTGQDNILTMPELKKDRFFVVATLPSPEFADEATIAKMAASAFSYPTGSQITSSYDPATQTVTETLKINFTNHLGFPNKPLFGLLPHHYLTSPLDGKPVLQNNPPEFKDARGTLMRFPTVRGWLHVYETDTVTCRFPFAGILPRMPDMTMTNAETTKFREWINVFILRHGNDHPPFTNHEGFNQNGVQVGVGQDSYNLAKFLGRNVLAAATIETLGKTNDDKSLAAIIRLATRGAIEVYWRQTPTLVNQQDKGQAPYYMYYDPAVGCLNQYPSLVGGPSVLFPNIKDDPVWDGFGTITRLNDHHFHYGYFIFAAAYIAFDDPAWGQQWKDAINLMIFDCAYDPSLGALPGGIEFPAMRNWDPYQNHSLAAGFNWDVPIGNNEESISEEMNFWAGVILWAAATNQPALMEHGIKHYAMAGYSSWIYWFDAADKYPEFFKDRGYTADLNWPGNGAARIFDAFTRWDTFFASHPVQCRGITMIPITPASFYHAFKAGHAKRVGEEYDKFVTALDIDPQKPFGNVKFSAKNQWITVVLFYGHLAKYYAMSDPANALLKYFDVPSNYDTYPIGSKDPKEIIVPNDKWTDIGDSGVFTFHFVTYLQKHGTPDPKVHAINTPFNMTFLDATTQKRTYVAYNHTGAALEVTFTDGVKLNVPARQLASFTQP